MNQREYHRLVKEGARAFRHPQLPSACPYLNLDSLDPSRDINLSVIWLAGYSDEMYRHLKIVTVKDFPPMSRPEQFIVSTAPNPPRDS